MSDELDVKIDTIGGYCPVQAEGTINGHPFYFRARGDRWSLEVYADSDPGEQVTPEWAHTEPYGTWPDAGYMPTDEALAFIRKAAARYAAGTPGADA